MVKLEGYWLTNEEWWHWTEHGGIIMNDNAPDEAKESYRKYKKQLADIDRRTGRWIVIPKDKDGWDYFDENDADWDAAPYSNKYMMVVKIPYDEFIILRENDIVDYMEDVCLDSSVDRMSQLDVKKCIKMAEPYKEEVPVFYAGLVEAEKYGFGIDFIEQQII